MTTWSRAVGVATLLAALAGVGAACSLTTLDGYAGDPLEVDGGDDATPIVVIDAAPVDASPTEDAMDAADARAVSLYAAAVLADHPMLYYRFGEAPGATLAVDSVASRNASLTGAVTVAVPGAIAGDPDTAYRFDGITSAVLLADGPSFAGTVPYSLEGWVRPTSFDARSPGLGGHCVISREKETDDGYSLYFYTSATPQIERLVAGSSGPTATGQLIGTQWTHLVATYDGHTQRLYVDGVLVATDDTTDPIPGKAQVPFVIGGNQLGTENLFIGDLDEIAVYDYPLGDDRVRVHSDIGHGVKGQ